MVLAVGYHGVVAFHIRQDVGLKILLESDVSSAGSIREQPASAGWFIVILSLC